MEDGPPEKLATFRPGDAAWPQLLAALGIASDAGGDGGSAAAAGDGTLTEHWADELVAGMRAFIAAVRLRAPHGGSAPPTRSREARHPVPTPTRAPPHSHTRAPTRARLPACPAFVWSRSTNMRVLAPARTYAC